MHVADCIELYLANHPMPRARLNAAWTTQLERSQEGSLSSVQSYGTSEGATAGWDVRGRKMAKSLGLPGAGAKTGANGYSWQKKGGYFDRMKDIHEKATAAGFTRKEAGGQDQYNVRHGSVFTHPDGWELETQQNYGGTKDQNWHSITLKKA
jgi:hypothetical protein